jgi:RNA polymerase sigma-70 factor (ECF subfamily)
VFIDDVDLGPEARYDKRESIALSFVAGLQRLPAQQRVALVLRDVLGFSAADVAGMLDSTPASVNSALQRARAGFRPGGDPEHIPLPHSEQEASVVEKFVRAFEQGDLDELISVLTDGATLTMPPDPFEFQGPREIGEFLRDVGSFGVKLVQTRANNQPALAYYRPDPNACLHRVSGIVVLTISGNQISRLTRFGDKGLLACFGLPRTLRS